MKKENMIVNLTLTLVLCLFTLSGFAQDSTSVDNLAKSAVEHLGGEKFINATTTVSRGSADITAFGQVIPAAYSIVISGDKYRLEIDNPFQPFKQAFDGTNTTSSIPGMAQFPPISKLGFPLLRHIGEKDYSVSALENGNTNGFRITSPEGYFTEFIMDLKNNEIKSYNASYVVDGRDVTTSVEIKKYEEVEGVLLPSKYDQRFDMGSMTIYASYKTKELLVNPKLDDAVFSVSQ
ncbi:MAG: hypothetical protein ACK5NT_00075 [Pyrinomonadaceae bacterium]